MMDLISTYLSPKWVIGVWGMIYLLVTDLRCKRRKIKNTYIPMTSEARVYFILRDLGIGMVLIVKMDGALFAVVFLSVIFCVYKIFMSGPVKVIYDRTDLTEKEKAAEVVSQNLLILILYGVTIIFMIYCLCITIWHGEWI